DTPQPIDHAARNIRLPIDFRRIEICIQKFAKFSKRLIQLALLRLRDARIRHHPIRHEMPLEKSFRQPQRLGPCKEQFLSLLILFLSLRAELVHSIEKWRRIVAVPACVSNSRAAGGLWRSKRHRQNDVGALNWNLCPQLHPWLVPQSMQTPQAPARITLALAQTGQGIPMKRRRSATVTRSGELLAPLPFPSADAPPFAGLVG